MEELEGIVQRMIDAGESEDAIAKVVQHYNDKLGKTSDPASVEATAGSENNTASSSETGLSESQNKVDEENTWIEDLFGEEKNAEDKLWGAVDFAGDILRSWDSGWQQGGTLDSALDLYNKGLENMTDKEKEELLADMNAAENMPRTQEMVDFDNKYADLIDKHGGIKAFFLGWKENPSVMAQYSSQSMAMMARSLENGESIKTALGAAATGFSAGYAASKYGKMIPGPIGKAISGISALQGAGGGLMGGISRTMEKGFTTMDLLNEKGLEIYGDKWTNATDEETLKMLEEMTSNKEMFDDIKSRAVARGNTIGFVDAVTGVFTIGVGSSVARRAATSRFSKITKPAAVVAAGATETAGGIVSEIGGQVAAEQDIDPKEYLIEGFADKTFTLTQAVKKGIRNNPKYSINGEVMNGKKFKETIMSLDDEAFVGGDFVIENSPVMNQIVENRKQDINIDLGISSTVDNVADRTLLIKLERELMSLSGATTQSQKNQASRVRQQINEIEAKYANNENVITQDKRKQAIAQARDNKFDRAYNKNYKAIEDFAKRKGLNIEQFENEDQYFEAIAKNQGIDIQNARKDAFGSDGAFVGKGKIFINKAQARKVGAVSVAQHEVLHPVLNAIVGGAASQGKLVNEFRKKLNRRQRAIIERALGTEQPSDTEYLTVFTDNFDAIMKERNIVQEISDYFKNMFKEYGFANIDFESGSGIYNFLQEYNNSIKEGKLSDRAQQAIDEAEAKSGVNIGEVDTVGQVQKSKIDYGAIEQRKGELDGTRDKSMIVAYDENFFKETMRRLRNVKLDDDVKEDIARSFILDDKRGLTKLLMDYDANRNDSVMGYLNGFVPQTKRSLFDARLQEFYESDPRYKNIIQSTTDENVARTVERKKAKGTPDKKDLGPVARKLSSFTSVDRNKNEKFYSKEVEQKAKDLISREIKLGVKNGLNASQIAENIKSIIETDVRDLIRSEMGAISRKKGEIVIPSSFRSLLEFGYEQILKSYPLARVKKMPGLFKKEKIGFTDKVTKKENKPELKKDSYYRKDDFKIYKPTKTELIKFFTEGGYTTLVEKQKRFAVDMSGDFAKVEVDKILNNQDMLESIVEIADGNENIVGVIQAEKLIQDISDYLDTKSEEKYGGDIVQFSKTAHSISRDNASLIPNIKNLITDNKGIFVRNYLNKVPNYIEKTVKDILRAEQDNLGIDRSQADKIAKEIGSKWRVKNFDAKAKKYNVEQATDFLLENIKYNLDQSIGFEAINAKLGFKNLQDLNSLDSINNARLAVKYLFDNLEFRDFVKFIMPAVTNPARLAGFEVKKAIKGFFVKPNEVKLNKKSARDGIFASQADIKNALNIKENTRGMFRDDNTFKHKKWYNNENSDFNNLDNDGQIAFAKDLYGKSQQEKKFMLKVIDLIKKAYDNKNLSLEQVQWLMRVLFAHQFSPGKVMAGVRYLPADVNGNILTRKQLHEQGLAYKNDEMVLEHMIPANYIRDAAYMYILTGDKNLLNQEIKNYDVAILPKLQDDKLRTTGVQSKMGINHKPGVNPLETRYDGTGLYFVDVTNGKVVGGPIQFSKSEVYQQDMSNKADRARLGPRKGLSVFDFDDTLAQTNSQVIVKMPDGKQFKINATEFALQSADLEAAGAVFDFSEFNKVIDGKKGPLFELAMKRQSKFGNKNIFILTARPQESAYAIHAFLKGIGLEVPIDNITGLEDGRAEAKAEWIKEKAAQGYNDFYFADDAYKNVKAVQDMLSGLGLEPNVEQAKVQFSKSKTYGKPQFSKTLDQEFNDIIEETKGVDSRTNVSKAAAKAKGESIKSTWFIPPGAEDFVGLIYQFLGKGVIGERQLKFFDEKLFKPFAKATAEMNRAKQAYVNGYQEIKKAFPGIRKRLNDRLSNGFMMQDAVRVYIWNKLGYDIPGLSQGEVQSMVRFVEKYSDITAYANSLAALTQDQGYIQPGENWVAGSIVSDINDLTTKTRRKAFLQEWIQNKNEIFSEKNLNKIESIYGSDFRSALEDMLWRMENGTNRKFGNNKLVNSFTNWVNNSVGAIMFFNMRSAVLQTISMFNFINWSDNNPLKAGAAVTNFDQYIKDFTFIFNSDMLKQRRSGLTTDINEAEIAAAVRGKGNTPQALLRYLLTKGFMPTQMADSFAIASGGATFYRNRINTYLQQGMSETEAQKQAFEDFAEISEKTQQSARPDLISQQQAGPLGRLILAFQNTPMQYTRLMKKAYLDLINGRGDAKTNISKIAYYGFLQNLLFTTLQSALFALMFEDDEDEKEEMLGKKGPRILNNMADTILRGTGIYGAGVSTVKNIILKFREQEAKGFRADHTYTVIEFMNLSPPIGSKARRLYSGIQTYKFNKDIIPEYGFGLGNPIYQSIGNVVAAATNVPLDRLFNKINNVRASLNRENETWQRIANFLGWNTWDVGSEYDPSLKKLKEKVKKQKKRDRKRSNSRNQKARDAAYERYRKNK